MDYGLNRHTLYRIPATAVSYTPALANRRVWWTGQTRQLPAGGGRMDLFQFADDLPYSAYNTADASIDAVWLRPFAVVTVDHV